MKIIEFLLTLAACLVVIGAQDDYDEYDDVLGRFHGQNCRVRDRIGVCKRRSRCRFQTNRVCRGSFRTVCCLDEYMIIPPNLTTQKPIRTTTTKRIQTTTTKRIQTTTTKRIQTTKSIATTRKPIRTTTLKSEELNEVDIEFPGCGTRIPRNSDPTPPPPNDNRGRRRDGLFSIFGRRRRKKRFVDGLDTVSRSKRNIKPVIVGGVTAKPNSWPWMTAIFKKVGANSRFLCGASLISKNYVLTAAHCFSNTEVGQPSKFTIKVGAHNTDDGQMYNIESIKPHPKYKNGQYYYDMCLLKIQKEVALGSKVHPVCLPSSSLRHRIGNTKKNVTVTGWGDTSFGGPNSKVLQEVELPIVPLKQCNESYHKIASRTFPDGITPLFLCAGLKEGGKDSCQGDSGGPLVMQMDGGTYVQLGVVSFGMGCAQPGFPGVYSRTSQLTRWIHDNTDLGEISVRSRS